MKRLLWAATAALALCAPACKRRPAAVPTYPQASVLLVSIDTLRADHLPAYGYTAGSTPRLDGLAREGIVFDDVYSPCPLTLPAHASMLTGLLPPHHGVRDNGGFTLDASHRTLATRFHDAGFATGGAVSAYILRRATGIAAGFDVYDDAVETKTSAGLGEQQRDGAVAVDRVGAWIAGLGGRRSFAFVHLYEPHSPYTPPPPYQGLASPYDGEIAYADELVGRLLDRLRDAGRLDDTIVAVTGDHGEGLGDHTEKEHGFFVYRESVRVPLILRLPKQAAAGRRVQGPVALTDLPATLLDLAGLDDAGMDGVSQRAALSSGRAPARPVYSETLFPLYHFGWSPLFAATDDRLRYIAAPRAELYDVREDPRERRNLEPERPQPAAAMRAWLDQMGRTAAAPAPSAVPPEVRERLEALGYVGTAPAAPASGPLRDPKDGIGAYEAYRDATALVHAGRDAEAVAALERVLADSPEMLDAREALGMALFRAGHGEDAVKALDAVVARDPTRASAHLLLARIHALAGRRALAERHAAQAAGGDPGRAFESLAESLWTGGRPDAAAQFARRAVAADPDRVAAHFVLGLAAARAGHCDEALGHFERAVAARQRQPGLVVPGLDARRGDCLARMGREQEAERAFQAEVAALPASAEGRIGLAILYRSQGKDAAARDALAGLVTSRPQPRADDYWTIVRTLAGLGDADGARQWSAQARAVFPNDPRFR